MRLEGAEKGKSLPLGSACSLRYGRAADSGDEQRTAPDVTVHAVAGGFHS